MLPKEHRLRQDKDIKALFGKAKGVFDDVTGIKFRANNLPVSRFAVVVGTKVSKRAVVRNRIRRQLRAVIHAHLSSIASGYDVVVLVRPAAKDADKETLTNHMLRVLKKAKLLSV